MVEAGLIRRTLSAEPCRTIDGTGAVLTTVWETASDVAAGNLQFDMHFLHRTNHLLGRFRFSVTTDDRSTFADELNTGGDVSANGSVLANSLVTQPAGMTFTTLGDNSVLAGGSVPSTGLYTVNYSTAINGIICDQSVRLNVR